MKLPAVLNEALNEQIAHELFNSNSYLQIAIYFDLLQFRNLAAYFMKQAQHERDHADKIIGYMCARTGGNPIVGAIDAPRISISSASQAADAYVMLEELTTSNFENIYDAAIAENSYMDFEFVLGMLKEQVEEEDEANHFALMVKQTKDLALLDLTWKG